MVVVNFLLFLIVSQKFSKAIEAILLGVLPLNSGALSYISTNLLLKSSTLNITPLLSIPFFSIMTSPYNYISIYLYINLLFLK